MKRIDLPIDAICSEYAAGDSARTIGLKYGVSHDTILNRLVDAGVLLREWRPKDESLEMQLAFNKAANSSVPIAHVASEYGVSRGALYNRLVRSGDHTPIVEYQDWTAIEMAFVSQHYKVDLSAQQIADRLGRTRNEIIGKARRMCLCSPLNSAATMEGNQLNKASAMRA